MSIAIYAVKEKGNSESVKMTVEKNDFFDHFGNKDRERI